MIWFGLQVNARLGRWSGISSLSSEFYETSNVRKDRGHGQLVEASEGRGHHFARDRLSWNITNIIAAKRPNLPQANLLYLFESFDLSL